MNSMSGEEANRCGRVRSAVAGGNVYVGEYRLPVGYALSAHTHAHRGFAIGLTGAYIARIGRREHHLGAGDVLLFPDGASHRERAGDGGGHCLLVQIDTDRFDDRGCESAFDRDDVFAVPALRRLGGLILQELAVDDAATPVALDALVADAIGELAAARGFVASPVNPAWVRQLRERLDAEFLSPPQLSSLAADVGRSKEHLARTFRRSFGVTIGEYVRYRRLDHAARQLMTTDAPLAGVASDVGFADQSHFTRWFRRRYRTTPQQFRQRRRSSLSEKMRES